MRGEPGVHRGGTGRGSVRLRRKEGSRGEAGEEGICGESVRAGGAGTGEAVFPHGSQGAPGGEVQGGLHGTGQGAACKAWGG